MTNELEQKLKEFGFPKPDSLDSSPSQYAEWWNQKGSGCGRLAIIYHKVQGFICCGWDTELKTDSDWKAVAAFIRFIKGEPADD